MKDKLCLGIDTFRTKLVEIRYYKYRLHRAVTVNRVNSSFPEGGHSAPLTSLIYTIYVNLLSFSPVDFTDLNNICLSAVIPRLYRNDTMDQYISTEPGKSTKPGSEMLMENTG